MKEESKEMVDESHEKSSDQASSSNNYSGSKRLAQLISDNESAMADAIEQFLWDNLDNEHMSMELQQFYHKKSAAGKENYDSLSNKDGTE